MANTSLDAKKVVLIGGTSGIGLAVAQAALAEGASVVVASSGAANVDAAVKRLGAGAQGAAVDVTDEADVARLFAGVGPFDHLVYTAGDWAAGGLGGGTLAELDLSAAKSTFTVRFWGAVAAAKHAHGQIRAGGSITLTDGVLAHRPWRRAAMNTAMLGAIEHLTRALAVDLAPVRVNAVCPGLVMTERNQALPEAVLAGFTARLPLARGGTPDEVAQAYLYAMRATYTTGQVLIVDGGATVA